MQGRDPRFLRKMNERDRTEGFASCSKSSLSHFSIIRLTEPDQENSCFTAHLCAYICLYRWPFSFQLPFSVRTIASNLIQSFRSARSLSTCESFLLEYWA